MTSLLDASRRLLWLSGSTNAMGTLLQLQKDVEDSLNASGLTTEQEQDLAAASLLLSDAVIALSRATQKIRGLR